MIEIHNISFAYGESAVLRDISFDVGRGECVGVLGVNGAGKSTLVTCLNRIRTPQAGEVRIGERDVLRMGRLEAARRVSYVAQKNELSRMTVFDCVLLGRKPHIHWSVSQEDLDLCREAIAQVGLTAFALRHVDTLSGGEQQKAMLARALVQQPQLLLLDEPTSNLDPRNQHEMLALVRRLAAERGLGAVIVMHDLSLALRYCHRFLFIKDGFVYRFGDASIITEETIADVYGIASTVAEVNGRKVVVVD